MSETVTQVSETVQQIVRSRTCGCRDFYIAKITQNDATGYVAGTPVKLARAIKAKVDEKWTSEKIYSDDGTEEVINSYEGTGHRDIGTVTMASAISKIPKRKMSCLPLLKMWNSFFIVSGIVIL